MERPGAEAFRVSHSTESIKPKDLTRSRRVYDDEDEGEAVRSGFEPNRVPPAEVSEFAIGEDDEEEEASDNNRDGTRNTGGVPDEGFNDSQVWGGSH